MIANNFAFTRFRLALLFTLFALALVCASLMGFAFFPPRFLGLTHYKEEFDADVLVRQLVSGDRRQKVIAITELRELGQDARAAVPALIEALKSHDIAFRLQAADALFALAPDKTQEALNALLSGLQSKDAHIRTTTLSFLEAHHDACKTVLSQLAECLKDDCQDVVETTTRILLRFEIDAQCHLLLLDLMHHKRFSVRLSAIAVLASKQKPQPAVVAALQDALDCPDNLVAVSAACALVNLGHATERVGTILNSALYNKDTAVRLNAAIGLATLDPDDKVPFGALRQLFIDCNDALERELVLSKLGPLCQRHRQMSSIVALGLSDDTPRVRLKALCALAQAGENSKIFVHNISKAVWDEDMSVRQCALGALATLGSAAKSALPELRVAINDSDKNWSILVAYTILRIKSDDKSGLRQMALYLKSNNEDVRIFAAEYISDLKPIPEDLLPLVLDRAKHDAHASVRELCCWGLESSQCNAQVLDTLATCLQDDDWMVRARAARTLKTFGKKAKPAVDALIRGLSDVNKGVRWWCACALEAMGGEAVAGLTDLEKLLHDPKTSVRVQAIKAIAAIDERGDKTNVILQAMKDDDDWWVRKAVETVTKKR